METGHDQRSLEWCFAGSLMILAIPVLLVAYTILDASVTTRFPVHVQTKATTRTGLLN
jgi:hypothetical protein